MPHNASRRHVLQGAASAALSTSLIGSYSTPAHAAEDTFDVVVIGSGAAGMTAALSAAKRGLSVVVIEKADKFGGSTARSGAGIWIRNNEVLQKAGVVDTPEQAATYLDAVVGPIVPAERKAAYLQQGPAMISFILRNTPLRFRWMEGYSDYYPELPGGKANGASIEPDQFDGKLLGSELANLNPPYLATPPGVVIFGGEYKWLNLAAVSAKGALVAANAVARYAQAMLKGQVPLTMGQALAAGLRAGLLQAKVPVWLGTPLVDLQFDAQGRANGVLVNKGGTTTLIRARRGVVMAAGGFEHNLKMRLQYQQQPITTDWTVGTKTNTGDGILAGQRAGGALDLMDDAWWGPVIPLPDGPYFVLAERTLPGSIMVNGQGQRFVNEAAPYTDFVHTMYKQVQATQDATVWMVVDQRFRNRYLFKETPPFFPLPQSWYDAGVAVKDLTLEGLATKMGVPPAALRNTVQRFNGFAEAGKDLDFHRGDSVYDHYYTDPAVRPSSSLAALRYAPFYAFKIKPGDLGTKGGLRTDARARVLRDDGSVIEGLYAAGNNSASVMGHSYPGAGSTIGPAMTFGYIAGNDLADKVSSL
ncbi:MAG: 3-oxosteroid 1-dehydrogenase [Aquabacterium sp.]|nr:3-oxosteroid 1-dehydrogenase [Aquabacterium sp.]